MKIYPDYAEYISKVKNKNIFRMYPDYLNYLRMLDNKKRLKNFLDKEEVIKSYNELVSSKDMSKIIGKNILRLRKSAMLTQKQVAKIIGCDGQIYGRIERGTKEADIGFLIKLAFFYSTSLDDLIGLADFLGLLEACKCEEHSS